MTTSQGSIEQIKYRILKIVDQISCNSINDIMDNIKLHDGMHKVIKDKFEDELINITNRMLKKYMDPSLYTKEIRDAMLDFVKEHDKEIHSNAPLKEDEIQLSEVTR